MTLHREIGTVNRRVFSGLDAADRRADLPPLNWSGAIEGQEKFTAQYDFFLAVVGGFRQLPRIEPAPPGYRFGGTFRRATAYVVALPKGQMTAADLKRAVVRQGSEGDAAEISRLRGVRGIILSTPIKDEPYVAESSRVSWIVDHFIVKSVSQTIVLEQKRETSPAGAKPQAALAGLAWLGGLLVVVLALCGRRMDRSLVAAADDRH